MNTKFNNYVSYNQEMAKSAYDKLGFINRIYENLDLIVDFGCAAGTVTRFMQLFYPGVRIIGYDLPEIMSECKAVENDPVEYMTDLTLVEATVKDYTSKDKKSLLVMNSVHHELFHYMKASDSESTNPSTNSINSYIGLLDKLYSIGFTYIFIRDLNVKIPTFGRCVDEIPTELTKLTTKIRELGYCKQFDEFIEHYNEGEPLNPMTLDGQEQYVHFLLKCRYKENWERELPENYLAFDRRYPIDGLFLSTIKRYPYHMTDSRSYVLPYVEFINNKEFGIDLRKLGITTHSQSLYKRYFEKQDKEDKFI